MKIGFDFVVGYNTASVTDLTPRHRGRTLTHAKYEGDREREEEHEGENERQSGENGCEEEEERGACAEAGENESELENRTTTLQARCCCRQYNRRLAVKFEPTVEFGECRWLNSD